jgi:hypothetical protein
MQRPRVRLDGMPTLQIPQVNEENVLNEKTPINVYPSGLGIANGLPKPPSIEVTSPAGEKAESSFNMAQRIEEKLWSYTTSDNTLKRWLLEILSWLFSAICMGAVVGVLIYLRGEPLSKWTLEEKTHLTLNTYISILSKMAGAALILPVSEALGQLKWSWFLEHSKQMWDFEIFDNASRGPWGSMLLLLRTKGRALAALGALIMLCSLALDPFFQQVVDFPERWALRSDVKSEIPRVVHYNPVDVVEYKHHIEQATTNKAMAAVLREFFYDNGTQPVPFGNGTRPDIPLSCPTSNCTWPVYETLAVCSRCEDVTDMLNISHTCLYTTIDWSANWTGPIEDEPYPNGTVCGYYLNATSEAPILLSGYLVDNTTSEDTHGESLLTRLVPLSDFNTKEPYYGNGSVYFKNIQYPLLDALVASVPNGIQGVNDNEAPVVHECMLSWCVQTIQSSYEWGIYSENVTSEYLGPSDPVPWPWQIPDEYTMSYNPNITLRPYIGDSKADFTFGVDNITVMNIIFLFDDIFPATYTAADADTPPVFRYNNYAAGPATRNMTFNPWQAPNDLHQHMERMAFSMTNTIRSSTSKQMILGKAYSQESYVEVRWQWLTLPIGLLCIAFIFLSATIAKSAAERDRVGVWKTSAYATLLYGLPDEMQKKITRSGSVGTPRARAKEMKVRLQPNIGWRVSGNLFTPKPKPQPPPGWI